jgi:adenosylhomocysteinase
MIQALKTNPEYIIDDGGELINLIHSRKISTIKGACEETTSGILQEQKLVNINKLNFP